MDNITISEEYVALEDAEYQALLRVARAAEKFHKQDNAENWLELFEALEALPPHLRDG